MAGKRGLIMGVANDRSIAWGIARACADQGAELAFTFQGEALEKRVRPLAERGQGQARSALRRDQHRQPRCVVLRAPGKLGQARFRRPRHRLFRDKDELKGQYVDTSRENFLSTMDISCFSFTDLCRRAAPMMTDGGSLLTLSYYGAYDSNT